jgi:hypothetical protein
MGMFLYAGWTATCVICVVHALQTLDEAVFTADTLQFIL